MSQSLPSKRLTSLKLPDDGQPTLDAIALILLRVTACAVHLPT
jgi:hypothetical protein